jgi:2-haloacid dehalogenase
MFALARPRFGILGRFSDIVVSGREGIVKPDPAIYLLACARLGVDPGATVFIDDSPANVAIAGEVGLSGLRFTSADALRDDLVGLGILGPRQPVTVPVFHWAVRADWEPALDNGSWPWSGRGLGYDSEGFVHLSFDHQLARTRERFYADLADDELVLLRLDPAEDLPIVVEDGFPHLFAPLPLDRVVQASAPA